MPKGKTRKFIDKKNSVTFHLVHRSQQDPLVADENAPQRVLVPVGSTQTGNHGAKSTKNRDERLTEQQKYGIYFDDEYDYLKHLKDVRSLPAEWERVDEPKNVEKSSDEKKVNINLPSSVFQSNVEEEIGLLNKAAPVSGPQLDLDPEIIAALDDDFDFDDPENELEDDFIQLANNQPSGDEDDGSYEDGSNIGSDDSLWNTDDEMEEGEDEMGILKSFKNEETKSRFTDYSMSSSVMKRNDQLSLLDNKFENVYGKYDENEIGPLDMEEIEGEIEPNSDLLLNCAAEYEKQQNESIDNINKLMKDRMKIIPKEESSSEDEGDMKLQEVVATEKWDCESVLSTYSNIYNHPKLIQERRNPSKIRIDTKTGVPKGVINEAEDKLTSKNLANLESHESMSVKNPTISDASFLFVRPKDETPEQRKERKQALKNHRMERRQERKANILAFKEEKKRQEKIIMNQRKNTQGDRIL